MINMLTKECDFEIANLYYNFTAFKVIPLK